MASESIPNSREKFQSEHEVFDYITCWITDQLKVLVEVAQSGVEPRHVETIVMAITDLVVMRLYSLGDGLDQAVRAHITLGDGNLVKRVEVMGVKK